MVGTGGLTPCNYSPIGGTGGLTPCDVFRESDYIEPGKRMFIHINPVASSDFFQRRLKEAQESPLTMQEGVISSSDIPFQTYKSENGERFVELDFLTEKMLKEGNYSYRNTKERIVGVDTYRVAQIPGLAAVDMASLMLPSTRVTFDNLNELRDQSDLSLDIVLVGGDEGERYSLRIPLLRDDGRIPKGHRDSYAHIFLVKYDASRERPRITEDNIEHLGSFDSAENLEEGIRLEIQQNSSK